MKIDKAERKELQEALRTAILVLCMDRLGHVGADFSVEGLLGVTFSDDQTFLININKDRRPSIDASLSHSKHKRVPGKSLPPTELETSLFRDSKSNSENQERFKKGAPAKVNGTPSSHGDAAAAAPQNVGASKVGSRPVPSVPSGLTRTAGDTPVGLSVSSLRQLLHAGVGNVPRPSYQEANDVRRMAALANMRSGMEPMWRQTDKNMLPGHLVGCVVT